MGYPAQPIDWISVKDRLPPRRRRIMVTGRSGYATPFLCLAIYDPEDRPLAPWRDVADDALSDMGWIPTHWAEPIELPRID